MVKIMPKCNASQRGTNFWVFYVSKDDGKTFDKIEIQMKAPIDIEKQPSRLDKADLIQGIIEWLSREYSTILSDEEFRVARKFISTED